MNIFWQIVTVCVVLNACASVKAAAPRQLDGFPRASYRGEDINGDFPEAISIKTRTQTFNTYHYFLVKDGLIWYKLRDPINGPFPLVEGMHLTEPKEWTLFQETGLPHNTQRVRFVNTDAVVEISADADELVALSEDGSFYRFCFDQNIAHESNIWLDKQGWPQAEQLFLDERTAKNRAWALGKRNDHVLYYEDTFGNQHHNGTMEIATTYILLEDGQEICYSDTGLPSDFSRNYGCPERGAFKAVSLSASASTMFLINEAGEMYTRMADFDIVGCDPMLFEYTYVPYTSSLPGTNYFSNLNAWALPSEDWRVQPRIELKGKAALTRHITILQNGYGNSARELRVAGYNEHGETGYWTKGIFDDTWTFNVVPLYFSEDALLKAEEGERGASYDSRFGGFYWNGAEKEAWYYEIPNFNIMEGSCDLVIKNNNGETCTLTLHPLELWTHLKRDYMPGRSEYPKIFFVTLEIEAHAFAGLSEDFATKLQTRYAHNDKKIFQYIMEASQHRIFLWDSNNPASVLFLTDGTVSDYFPAFRPEDFFKNCEELIQYNSTELDFFAAEHTNSTYAQELSKTIALNKIFLKTLKEQISQLKAVKKATDKWTAGYKALDFLSRITLLNNVKVPKIKTITQFGDRIVSINKSYTDTLLNARITLDTILIELVQLRIKNYTALEKRFN
ncbi:MAG: hypothetical protein LBQ77_01760 [Treponema sp.]|nr:hypothetical protein [Treponema sp.]